MTPDPEMDKVSSILIVEDDQSMLNVLTEGLSISGYHCETAPNAEGDLKRLGKTFFRFVSSWKGSVQYEAIEKDRDTLKRRDID